MASETIISEALNKVVLGYNNGDHNYEFSQAAIFLNRKGIINILDGKVKEKILQSLQSQDFLISGKSKLKDRVNNTGWACESFNGNLYIACYDSDNKILLTKIPYDVYGNLNYSSATQTVTSKTYTGTDDHNFISLGHDGNNFLWCAYGMHAGALQIFRFDAANSITTAQANEGTLVSAGAEGSVTYPLFWLNPTNSNEMYFMFRDGSSGNGQGRLYVYNASTTSWTAAVGTFTSAGQFFINTRSGGTVSPYIGRPFIKDHLAIFMYIIRVDTSSNKKNTDVNILIYNMKAHQFEFTDGTVYTNSIQFDAGTSTRAPEKVVDIATQNGLETDYIRMQVVKDSLGAYHIVYARFDGESHKQVYYVKYQNQVATSPLQLTFEKQDFTDPLVAADDEYKMFMHPSIYITKDEKLITLYTPTTEPESVYMCYSDNYGISWSDPTRIQSGIGNATTQNMDINLWYLHNKFYFQWQEGFDQDYIWEMGRKVFLSELNLQGCVDRYVSTQHGDTILGSHRGNTVLVAGFKQVVKSFGKHTTLHILDHQPDAGPADVNNLVLRPTLNNVSPTRYNYITIEDPTLSGSGSVTDGTALRYNAAAGTHKAVDAGSTKTTPSSVDAWPKININGTIYYIPAYLSKTA